MSGGNTAGQCPICGGKERESRVCQVCWRGIARDLYAVPALLADLDLAAAKQAQLGPPTPGGLASERNPVGWGAAEARARLGNTLTTWARDVAGEPPPLLLTSPAVPPALAAARLIHSREHTVRAHPAAAELAQDIADAVTHARRTIDRQDRHIDIGDCPEPDCPGTLRAHLPADDHHPTRITCRANPTHEWSPDQWLRLGRRILGKATA